MRILCLRQTCARTDRHTLWHLELLAEPKKHLIAVTMNFSASPKTARHPRPWFLLILSLDLLIPCNWLEIKYFHRGNETDLSRCWLMPGWWHLQADQLSSTESSPSSDKTISTDNLMRARARGRCLWVVHHKTGSSVIQHFCGVLCVL